jgi:hypothetical protein
MALTLANAPVVGRITPCLPLAAACRVFRVSASFARLQWRNPRRERKESVPIACAPGSKSLPLWLKLLYTAFVAVLVPVYWWSYGPTNFLFFCDVALLMTLLALWLECALFASAALVGIFLGQMVWVADFLGILIGFPVNNTTAYMYNPELSLFTRFLSFFHFWLPFFLLWLVWRLGYDRRGFWLWTVLAWIDLSICYFLMPGPPPSLEHPNVPVNINYVYGFSDKEPQQWIANPNLYFVVVMLGLPLAILLPSHLAFCFIFRHRTVPVSGAKRVVVMADTADSPTAAPPQHKS